MRINNNIMAINTHRQLGMANKAGAKSMEKLSSGLRVNRAADDAAGLSISEKMRNQVRGLNRASSNSQDGISLIQTAEGALDESHSILKRMRELVVQSGNEGTLQEDDLEAIKDEFSELTKELDGISERTEFNGKKLLDGKYNGILQIGANQEQQMDLDIFTKDINGSHKLLGDTKLVTGQRVMNRVEGGIVDTTNSLNFEAPEGVTIKFDEMTREDVKEAGGEKVKIEASAGAITINLVNKEIAAGSNPDDEPKIEAATIDEVLAAIRSSNAEVEVEQEVNGKQLQLKVQ